jgi:large subunit ribosomal protein L14
MIQTLSRLRVCDNTGVQEIGCIRVVARGGDTMFASLGDVIVASTKQVSSQSSIPRGTVVRAVVVRCRHTVCRPDGTAIRFDDNAAVIIDANGNPRGTRVFGPVARELRDKQYMKIVSLAPEVV